MIKYQNYSGIINNLFKISRTSGCLVKRYSIHTENETSPIKTVDLAYASYETAISENKGLPPLIILHGLLGSKNNWTSMSKAIHKNTGRKVIAIDARNHGDSPHSDEQTYRHMAEDVIALMKKLNIPKTALLGHSMGGRTAMILALIQPDLVSNLIVGDISPLKTSPNIMAMDDLFDAMAIVSIPRGIPLSQARKIADEQLSSVVSDTSVRSFIITNLVQSDSNEYAWRVNLPVLKKNFKMNIAGFPTSFNYIKYPGPTLFVAGGLSDYVGRDDLRSLKGMFPEADLVFIEGAGHWVHSQKPEEFLNTVCDFLTKN